MSGRLVADLTLGDPISFSIFFSFFGPFFWWWWRGGVWVLCASPLIFATFSQETLYFRCILIAETSSFIKFFLF